MKTFDEACMTLFVRKVGSNPTPEVLNAAGEDVMRENARYADIAAEVQASEHPDSFMEIMIQALAAGELALQDVLISAIIHGVCIGIEMERGDPPVPSESVPGRRDTPPDTPESKGYTGL